MIFQLMEIIFIQNYIKNKNVMRNNSKIHVGLENAEIRDFLSLSIVKNMYMNFIGTEKEYKKLMKDLRKDL